VLAPDMALNRKKPTDPKMISVAANPQRQAFFANGLLAGLP
jgi:hypothetical protein